MALQFPSDEWIKAWEETLENDPTYQEASDGWGVEFDGDFVFHLRADDRLPEDRYFFVGLEDGDVYDCREIEDPDEVDHGFVYAGDYSDWVRMIRGDVGAIDGLMSGTFDVQGDMQRVLQYSDAAAAMVDVSNQLEDRTEFVY